MYWSYRIVRKPSGYHTIIEVSYDEHDNIVGWSDCNPLTWYTPEDLIGTIQMLQKVVNKPILEEVNGELIERKIK